MRLRLACLAALENITHSSRPLTAQTAELAPQASLLRRLAPIASPVLTVRLGLRLALRVPPALSHTPEPPCARTVRRVRRRVPEQDLAELALLDATPTVSAAFASIASQGSTPRLLVRALAYRALQARTLELSR